MLNVLHGPLDKRVFQKVARSLIGAGHEVISICPGDGPAEDGGVRFRYIPAAASKPARLMSVWRLIQAGRREMASVYYAPEPESWCAALCLKWLRGGRVVFDMHEHAPSEFAKFFPAPLRPAAAWLTTHIMRLFAQYTDAIILTRDSFDALWSGLGTPRTVVLNTNHLQPPCTEIPEVLRDAYAGRPTLIHQGIFGDVRGSYQLLEAMRLLAAGRPGIRCIVLGDYAYGSEDAYRAAIDAAGLGDAIRLLATVPYEEVPAHIAVSGIGLILFQPGPLNHTLAMPHKLFDYMREGKPVIVPDFAVEVTRIVREADCGLCVDVTGPEAIADAVASLLDNPEEASRLGANGRRAVESKYHWERDEERLLEVFAKFEGGEK